VPCLCITRGPSWQWSHVLFRSDNMAVVDLLRKHTSPDLHVMHLLRSFMFYAALLHFTFTAEHVPGTHNTVADASSRDNISLPLCLGRVADYPLLPECLTFLPNTCRSTRSLFSIFHSAIACSQVLTIHLRKSKTDPFWSGCFIYLGRTYHLLCLMTAILVF